MKKSFTFIILLVLCISITPGDVASDTWTPYLLGTEILDITASDRDIWCAAYLDGLYCLDRRDGSVTCHIPSDSLGTNMVTAVEIDTDGVLWVGTKDGVRSFAGQTWTDYPESRQTERGLQKIGHTIESDYDDYITCIAVDSTGGKWFGYYGRLVQFSIGELSTYDMSTPGFFDNFFVDITVDSIGRVWAGTMMGGAMYYQNDTWTTVSQDRRLWLFQGVYSIGEDRNGTIWFGGYSGKGAVYDGVSFTEYPNFIDIHLKQDIVACAADADNVVWFGAYDGVSRFDGAGWETINEACGLPLAGVRDIEVDIDNTKWFATGNGIRRLETSPSDVYRELYRPDRLILSTPFPNPFNSATTFSFSLIRNGSVRVEIFDSAGRKAATLADRYFPAGRHAIPWKPTDNPSGVYLYRVTFEGIQKTGKVSLVR